jgi:RNA exonuclease 1
VRRGLNGDLFRLENDLKSLRLIHRKVIDTAVLFPHPKGPPFRRALKDL